jgi:ribosomal protein L30E
MSQAKNKKRKDRIYLIFTILSDRCPKNNDDPEMVEQIKNRSAKLQVADSLENDSDLSSDSLTWARNQLMSNFLQREGGFSLTDVAVKTDSTTRAKSLFQKDKNGNEVTDSGLPALLAKMSGLESELLRSLESPVQPAVPTGNAVPLLKISNGTVSWGTTESTKENAAPSGSVKGVEGLEKVNQPYQPQEQFDLTALKASIEARQAAIQEQQERAKAGIIQHSFVEDVVKNSKHFDTLAWALGLESDHSWNPLQNSWRTVTRSVQTKANVLSLRAQNQANWEKIDKKITVVLKSDSIVLGANETLKFKVNQRGEITVGDGVSGDKRKKIEKLLNEDKTLAQDLLYAHAERRWSVMGGRGSSSMEDEYGREGAERYILTDTVLRWEYGVSLSDIQMFGGEHTDLLDKIYNEERMFYDDIERALKALDENGGDFEIKFAYQNGITVEPGITHQSALDKAAEQLFHPWAVNPAFGVTTSVTIDPTGRILNAQVTSPGLFSALTDNPARTSRWLDQQIKTHLDWGEKYGSTYGLYNNSNVLATQSRLQQYAFDAQRLFQFNTGADSTTAKAMNVTFNTNGTTW